MEEGCLGLITKDEIKEPRFKLVPKKEFYKDMGDQILNTVCGYEFSAVQLEGTLFMSFKEELTQEDFCKIDNAFKEIGLSDKYTIVFLENGITVDMFELEEIHVD